ncbi:MAG TPA: peptidoglycan DD-metalloendopeptidase family protein [Thermoanaerobaculia bacterium]|nr:peptidoglycan DD-metalloendopeptidase family protein [Thermoanaerobaculia bacterium]
MPSRRRLLPLLLLPLLLPLHAPAQTTPTREQELATIRGEITQLESRLARVRDRAAGLAGELETIEVELELQEQRLAEARAAGALAGERVEASAAEVARLGESLAAAREALAGRVGGLYRLGRRGYLRMLLSLDGGAAGEADERASDLLSGIRMLRYLAQRDARAVERYTLARQELEEERELLAARRAEVERWVAEEDARRGELASARSRQAAILARVENEERQLAGRAVELADREEKLTDFLALLAGRGGEPEGTPIQRFRGVLDRPVAGEVSAGFGPRLDPRYRTRVPHNGLTLTTRSGDEVHAVYAGEVLFAAPFQGYGPTVVVHHPGRVFTLYAGLGELAVERGVSVALGETVGTAADSLYFEVRVEKKPEDPTEWVR